MIKSNLDEALGVPNHIFESSVDIYNEILNQIKNDTEKENEKNLTLNIDFKIGNLNFNKIELTITCTEYDGDNYQWSRMAVGNSSELNNKYFFKHNIVEGEFDLIINIAVPETWDYNGVIKLFIDEKNKMIESISHELMHVYESNKKGIADTRSLAEYVAAGKVRTGLDPIDIFGFYLYYTTMIENIVRPTEVSTYLKLNNATRKKFLELLKDNDTYKKLIDIRNFSYDNMRTELLGMIDKVDEFFEKVGIDKDEYSDLKDEEKIDLLLKIYHNSLMNVKADTLQRMLSTSFMEIIQGFIGDKDKFFRKFINKISRFKSAEDFFRYSEKYFKFISNKMIKKISKLYAMFDKEKVENIQESIINWDLYHNINRTQEKYLNELKFIRIKSVK